ncbi:hypothetical protein BDR03DRAFT_1018732 [Suillus americanus]|nr:hypothetical protein BDR03DRAFT_1018732 [Suillus americanus]
MVSLSLSCQSRTRGLTLPISSVSLSQSHSPHFCGLSLVVSLSPSHQSRSPHFGGLILPISSLLFCPSHPSFPPSALLALSGVFRIYWMGAVDGDLDGAGGVSACTPMGTPATGLPVQIPTNIALPTIPYRDRLHPAAAAYTLQLPPLAFCHPHSPYCTISHPLASF